MFVPPSSNRKGGILESLNASGRILQTPGLPPEIWTPEAKVRWWVEISAGCAGLAAVSAVATWFLAGQHIEGMGGIAVLLSFYCWLGGSFFGLLGGIVTACMTKDEEQRRCLRISAANGGLLVLALLFLVYR